MLSSSLLAGLLLALGAGFLAFALSLLPEERVVFFLLVFFSAMIPFLFQKIIVRMMASTPITQQ